MDLGICLSLGSSESRPSNDLVLLFPQEGIPGELGGEVGKERQEVGSQESFVLWVDLYHCGQLGLAPARYLARIHRECAKGWDLTNPNQWRATWKGHSTPPSIHPG